MKTAIYFLISLVICETKEYIVVLKNNVEFHSQNDHYTKVQEYIDSQVNSYSSEVSNIETIFDPTIINGYEGKFNEDTINFIKKQPEVEYVELDQIASISDGFVPYYIVKQENCTWNLDRISHKFLSKPKDRSYNYDSEGGKNVLVYVLDTGIDTKHIEFQGRAKVGISMFEDETEDDGNGHGTHVAGIIGGSTYGVSKKVELVSIKVLDKTGSGKSSDIIKGIEWAIKDMDQHPNINAFVINMSLGCNFMRSVNQVVQHAHNAGILVVSAAGNDNVDACEQSPGSAEYSFTIGSTDINDAKSGFSNFGRCVNLWAPGTTILSSWIGVGNKESKFASGTSMATPHVAGVAAYLASQMGPKVQPSNLRDYISITCSRNLIKDLDPASENRLLFFIP